MMMKRISFLFGSIALLGLSACSDTYVQPDAPIKEVPFTQVHLNDNFWTPRIEINRTISIPSAFKECEKNGRFDNFAIAGGLMKGEHRGDFSFVVKDKSGEPIIGANILEKGTTNGVITNVDGEYTLKVKGANSVLIVSYIGYKSQEISVGAQRKINVNLQDDTELLDEVVVIGYGTQTKAMFRAICQDKNTGKYYPE